MRHHSRQAIYEGKVVFDVVRALRDRATDARKLARTCGNNRAAENILSYAAEMEREADKLEKQLQQDSKPKTNPKWAKEHH